MTNTSKKKRLIMTATEEESKIINKIATRCVKLDKKHGNGKWKHTDAFLDIVACHCNGNPLDLQKLLDADDFNFRHDVLGINRHLNRETGELMDHFSPRTSL